MGIVRSPCHPGMDCSGMMESYACCGCGLYEIASSLRPRNDSTITFYEKIQWHFFTVLGLSLGKMIKKHKKLVGFMVEVTD